MKRLGIYLGIFLMSQNICAFTSFAEFKEALFKRPVFQNIIGKEYLYDPRELKSFPHSYKKTENIKGVVDYNEFLKTVQEATAMLKKQNSQATWFGSIADLQDMEYERLEVATIFPRDHILQIVGDQHASGHDTALFLGWSVDNFNPFLLDSWALDDKLGNKHWIFAGDITDTGAYGVESLYAILKAYIANPYNIHLLRGNHEDISINDYYGFTTELNIKYGNNAKNIIEAIKLLYNYLPVAYWVAFEKENKNDTYDWTLICHGGIDQEDRNIQDLFGLSEKSLSKQSRKLVYNANKRLHEHKSIGYQWTDFLMSIDGYSLSGRNTGLFDLGQNKTIENLNRHSSAQHIFSRVIRAHQHSLGSPIGKGNPIMTSIILSGFSSLWNSQNQLVFTLSVVPCTGFGIPELEKRVSWYTTGYPGIVHLNVAVLDKENLSFYQLSNKHIPEWVKNQHIKNLESRGYRNIRPHDISIQSSRKLISIPMKKREISQKELSLFGRLSRWLFGWK